MEPVWVSREAVLAIHEAQIAEHGGASGLRDAAALDIALARPRDRHAFGETGIVALAAHYAFGLARNHAFVDGNKRVSAVVTELFLALNGFALTTTDSDLVTAWVDLASGDLDADAFASWLARETVPDPGEIA